MTCPHCSTSLQSGVAVCPQCGVTVLRNVTAVMRTSAVWIAAGGEPKFYGSLHDVPELLRKRLVECTNGVNSGTIVIADRGGRDRLIANASGPEAGRKILRGTQYARAPRFPRTPRSRAAQKEFVPELPTLDPVSPPPAALPPGHPQWAAWAGLALALASAGIIAFAFGVHW